MLSCLDPLRTSFALIISMHIEVWWFVMKSNCAFFLFYRPLLEMSQSTLYWPENAMSHPAGWDPTHLDKGSQFHASLFMVPEPSDDIEYVGFQHDATHTSMGIVRLLATTVALPAFPASRTSASSTHHNHYNSSMWHTWLVHFPGHNYMHEDFKPLPDHKYIHLSSSPSDNRTYRVLSDSPMQMRIYKGNGRKRVIVVEDREYYSLMSLVHRGVVD